MTNKELADKVLKCIGDDEDLADEVQEVISEYITGEAESIIDDGDLLRQINWLTKNGCDLHDIAKDLQDVL